jgi:hypothetical protein
VKLNGAIVAERTFYIKGDKNKKIVLRIRAPFADNPDFVIDMDGVSQDDYPCYVGGCDSIQAFLQTALLLKIKIDEINLRFFGGNLRWLDDDDLDLGIYSSFTK